LVQEGETKPDRLSATAGQADFAHSSVMRIAEADPHDDAHRQTVTPEEEAGIHHDTDVLPDQAYTFALSSAHTIPSAMVPSGRLHNGTPKMLRERRAQ
jgi:hypothetical protein